MDLTLLSLSIKVFEFEFEGGRRLGKRFITEVLLNSDCLRHCCQGTVATTCSARVCLAVQMAIQERTVRSKTIGDECG